MVRASHPVINRDYRRNFTCCQWRGNFYNTPGKSKGELPIFFFLNASSFVCSSVPSYWVTKKAAFLRASTHSHTSAGHKVAFTVSALILSGCWSTVDVQALTLNVPSAEKKIKKINCRFLGSGPCSGGEGGRRCSCDGCVNRQTDEEEHICSDSHFFVWTHEAWAHRHGTIFKKKIKDLLWHAMGLQQVYKSLINWKTTQQNAKPCDIT